jgi:hypothetical protein
MRSRRPDTRALPVGSNDGEHRHVDLEREVLEILDDPGHPLLLDGGAVRDVRLLQVVDDHERLLAGALGHLADDVTHHGDAGRHAGGSVDAHPVAPRLDRLDRLHPAGVVSQPLDQRAGSPADRLHRVPDPPQGGAVGSDLLRRLQREEPLEHVDVVVLEGEVDRAATLGHGVPQDLQRERGLAETPAGHRAR